MRNKMRYWVKWRPYCTADRLLEETYDLRSSSSSSSSSSSNPRELTYFIFVRILTYLNVGLFYFNLSVFYVLLEKIFKILLQEVSAGNLQ